MKYLIKESRLEEFIVDYLNKMFPIEEMSWNHPVEYFQDRDEEDEDLNRVVFYLGPSMDDESVFRWYGCDYFNPDSHAQNICPTVDLENEFSEVLNGYFGNRWVEPFKKWFTLNFELPVETVEWM